MKVEAKIIIEADTRNDIEHIMDCIEAEHTWSEPEDMGPTKVEIIEQQEVKL